MQDSGSSELVPHTQHIKVERNNHESQSIDVSVTVNPNTVVPKWKFSDYVDKYGLYILTIIVGPLIYLFFDMRAKINSIDDRVKAEVATQVNDMRKEVTADYKKTSEELVLIKDAMSLDKILYDLSCNSQYAEVLQTYTVHTQNLKIDLVPDTLAASIYKYVITAIAITHRYTFFQQAELDKIESLFQKNHTACSSNTNFYFSMLHAANGNHQKSKKSIITAIETSLASRKQDSPDLDMSGYYAQYLLVSLCDPSQVDASARSRSAWETLTMLESNYVTSTDRILAQLANRELDTFRNSLALRYGTVYQQSYQQIISNLTTIDFAYAPVTYTINGKTITVMKVIEISKPPKASTPEPKKMDPPKPSGNDC